MKTTLVLALLAVLSVATAEAGEAEHERARREVLAGEILPLRAILERAEADYPGHFLEAELERKRGRAIYEIKVLTTAGRVLELEYDARSGELLEVEDE